MKLIHEPSRDGLGLWAAMALMVAGAILWWGLEKAHGAQLRPSRASGARMTVDDVAKVISCQVRTQHANVVQRRMVRYYNADQVMVYAKAVRSGLKAQEWPEGLMWQWYVPLMLATVYQQSRWQYDAVSKWNTDRRGVRIKIHPQAAWSKPNYDLDYGLGQIHWGWAYKRVGKVSDLMDPATNLRVLGWWFARRAQKCVGHWERKRCRAYVRGDRACDRKRKCLLTRTAFGVPGYAGTTDNLVRTFALPMWRCVEQAMMPAEEKNDGRTS